MEQETPKVRIPQFDANRPGLTQSQASIDSPRAAQGSSFRGSARCLRLAPGAGQGELSQCIASFLRYFFNVRNQLSIVRQVPALKARHDATKIIHCQVIGVSKGSIQKSPPERRARNKGEAKLAARWQDIGFGIASTGRIPRMLVPPREPRCRKRELLNIQRSPVSLPI
jgi:hypothetical protein